MLWSFKITLDLMCLLSCIITVRNPSVCNHILPEGKTNIKEISTAWQLFLLSKMVFKFSKNLFEQLFFSA